MNGKELKSLRISYNLTQKELADAIGANRVRISEWENDKYSISKSYQRLLLQYFEKIK